MDAKFSIRLPEELVELIVARMPLPSIFKARELSRAWLAKFSSISSQENEEKKGIAFRFQRLVCSNWSTFLFPVCLDDDILSAYDCQNERWLTFPNLPFLHVENLYDRYGQQDGYSKNLDFLNMDGTLLCSVHHKPAYDRRDFNDLCWEYHVANILTGKWKELPPLPKFKRQNETMCCNPVFVRNAMQGAYKLVLLRYLYKSSFLLPWYAQIYDSVTGGWTTKKFTITTVEASSSFAIDESSIYLIRIHNSGVCLNGIIYYFVYQKGRSNSDILLALDIERGTFEKIQLSFNGFDRRREDCTVNLILCNGELMMVVTYPDPNELTPECYPYLVSCVLKVDLGSRQILKVARAPSWARELVTCAAWGSTPPHLFSTDGRCIFFKHRHSGYRTSRLVAYDVRQDAWRYQNLPCRITMDCEFFSNHLDLDLMHPFADI